MDASILAQRLNNFQRNLEVLYSRANTLDQQQLSSQVRVAYKELGTASEELQIAVEELLMQTEELAALKVQLKAERQQYKEMFEFLPSAYLVSDARGNILQANQATAALFNIEPQFMSGKPLDIYLIEQERRTFPSKLIQLQQHHQIQRWRLCFQPRDRPPFDADVSVVPIRDAHGKLVNLRWSLYDPKNKQIKKNNQLSFIKDCPRHFYGQGEIISLNPSSIWLVCQGLVKLSTTSEDGAEVMVGIAGPIMPFGSSITSLPTYQATALSEAVQVVSLPLIEIANPRLRKMLLPQIIRRLQQTETLLAISGKRHVQDRLHYMLSWLKQNYSEPAAQGTRLSIRLTHQELADACCTTRVTVARKLSQLKKQGKIAYDSKQHIVFDL